MRCVAILFVIALGSSARADQGSSEFHDAKTSFGLAGSIVGDASIAALVELHGSYRIARKIWIDLAIGKGTAGLLESEGIDGASSFDARGGMSYRSCSKLTCFGPQLSFGYHRQQVEYSSDFLVDPDGYTQKRHDMFVEARLLGRVRLIQGWLAFELSLGVRGTYATVNQRTSDEDRSTAFVGALGIYGTI